MAFHSPQPEPEEAPYAITYTEDGEAVDMRTPEVDGSRKLLGTGTLSIGKPHDIIITSA